MPELVCHRFYLLNYHLQTVEFAINLSLDPSSTPPFPKWLIRKENLRRADGVALHFRILG